MNKLHYVDKENCRLINRYFSNDSFREYKFFNKTILCIKQNTKHYLES